MTPWLLLDIVLALAAIIAAAIYITRPVPEPEGARDITINRDQAVGERLNALRKLQADGHRQEQARNSIKRGW